MPSNASAMTFARKNAKRNAIKNAPKANTDFLKPLNTPTNPKSTINAIILISIQDI